MSDQTPKTPLSRLEAFLKQLKVCIALTRDVLVEVKDLLVITTVILFFVLGVRKALRRVLASPPQPEVQTVSRPYEQRHK